MKTIYFDHLIDDFGIWQHTNGQRILKQHGYALDDAARGLLACLTLNKRAQAEVLFGYLERSYKDSHLYGFAHADHTFFDYPASEDATAQTIWALGYAYSLGFQKAKALKLIRQLQPALDAMTHVRGPAYALLGALYVDEKLTQNLLTKLQRFFANATREWPWAEDIMTYGNGILPYAFLRHAIVTGDKTSANFGRRLLEFVQEKCETDRVLGPIGNEGWLARDSDTVPDYSQQPIDSAYMIWAWLAAHQLSHLEGDLAQAARWWQWFEGNNILKTRMYDPKTLKAYDGIDRQGVHYHSGAESNICLVLSMKLLETKQTI